MDLMEHVRMLADEIGPREAGSQGERAAADAICARFRQLGLEVEEQPFSTVRSFSHAFLVIYGLGLVAALAVGPVLPGLAVVLGLAAAWCFWRETETWSPVNRWFRRWTSRNVLGRLRPQGPVRQRLAVIAHYDSSRAALVFHPRLVGGFRQSLLLMAAALFGAPAGWLLSLAWPPARWLALACGIYMLVPIALLLHRELAGRVVPGANDNASGVAAMLGVAAELAAEPPAATELWFVATGAEEAGTIGMAHLLGRCRPELTDTPLINLDNLGRGELKFTVGEGVLSLRRTDPDLVESFHRVAVERGIDAGPWLYRTLTTDATTALVRGYRALSVMAFDRSGNLPNWHWPTDTSERIDPQNIVSARDLVVGVVRDLDHKVNR